MAKCIVCGNHYAKAFEISLAEKTYVFDCFECAIHHLAPTCHHCGCKIIGHGLEEADSYYCCHHCARQASA